MPKGSRCAACGAFLSRYNPDSLCSPCGEQRSFVADPDYQASDKPPRSFGDKADEVLSVAQRLLEPPDDPHLSFGGLTRAYRENEHGTIAAAFLTRFLPGWNERLEREIEAAYESIRRLQRREPGSGLRWNHAFGSLIERGVLLHLAPYEEMEPRHGPEVVPATALSFLDHLARTDVSALEISIHIWSALISDECLRETVESAVETLRDSARLAGVDWPCAMDRADSLETTLR
jgi:hypothetical protein